MLFVDYMNLKDIDPANPIIQASCQRSNSIIKHLH